MYVLYIELYWKIYFKGATCKTRFAKCFWQLQARISMWFPYMAEKSSFPDGHGTPEVTRRNCIGAAARAWVTSDYVTSVPCCIIRLPTALSRCWDNGSIRMDHDPGLDVLGTLEINACIMIPAVLFHHQHRGSERFVPGSPVAIRIDRRLLQNTCFTSNGKKNVVDLVCGPLTT